MAQSEQHYAMDKVETGSTYSHASNKTSITNHNGNQRGYSRQSKKQIDKIEEEELTKKWEAENKKMKQYSKESKRRLNEIKKKEAAERMRILEEQNNILEKKKKQKEQYHVHNIRNQISSKQKNSIRPPNKPVNKPQENNKITKKEPSQAKKFEEEKITLKDLEDVKLEDFLPNNNLAGLDLDVRGSMELKMQKHFTKEDEMIKKGDLIDSLDLQIAAIIGDKKGSESTPPADSLDSCKPKKKEPSNSPNKPEEIEIEEKIECAEDEKAEWLKKSIKSNVENWKKVNNQIRKEKPLQKISTANKAEVVQELPLNRLISLGKEEIKTDKVLLAESRENNKENLEENKRDSLEAENKNAEPIIEPPKIADEPPEIINSPEDVNAQKEATFGKPSHKNPINQKKTEASPCK